MCKGVLKNGKFAAQVFMEGLFLITSNFSSHAAARLSFYRNFEEEVKRERKKNGTKEE
jgi:hypothetical protein